MSPRFPKSWGSEVAPIPNPFRGSVAADPQGSRIPTESSRGAAAGSGLEEPKIFPLLFPEEKSRIWLAEDQPHPNSLKNREKFRSFSRWIIRHFPGNVHQRYPGFPVGENRPPERENGIFQVFPGIQHQAGTFPILRGGIPNIFIGNWDERTQGTCGIPKWKRRN